MAKDRIMLMKKEPDFEKASDKLLRFIELYVETGNHIQSWKDAGYSESGIGSAMNTLRNNHKLVEKMIGLRVGRHVPAALNTIVDLMEHARNDSVKLKAAQDVLYRAGYDRPMEIITTEKKVDELDNKALDDELQRLLARVNDKADKQKELH